MAKVLACRCPRSAEPKLTGVELGRRGGLGAAAEKTCKRGAGLRSSRVRSSVPIEGRVAVK